MLAIRFPTMRDIQHEDNLGINVNPIDNTITTRYPRRIQTSESAGESLSEKWIFGNFEQNALRDSFHLVAGQVLNTFLRLSGVKQFVRHAVIADRVRKLLCECMSFLFECCGAQLRFSIPASCHSESPAFPTMIRTLSKEATQRGLLFL